MDWTSIIGPAVVAAVVSSAVSVIGFVVSNRTARAIHREKLEFDKDLAERKAKADIALAERKFALDRDFSTWKRLSELAEQALVSFNQVEKVFRWVRSPGMMNGEGESRPADANESAHLKKTRDLFFIPIERMRQEKELFSTIQVLRPAFEAHFGPDAGKPFDEISQVFNEITSAAYTLIDATRFASPPPPLAIAPGWQPGNETLRNTLGWGPRPRPDDIDRRIEVAVEKIAALCRPVLAWKPS
jgi:hypothetical protein